jgi:hypothetical protein
MPLRHARQRATPTPHSIRNEHRQESAVMTTASDTRNYTTIELEGEFTELQLFTTLSKLLMPHGQLTRTYCQQHVDYPEENCSQLTSIELRFKGAVKLHFERGKHVTAPADYLTIPDRKCTCGHLHRHSQYTTIRVSGDSTLTTLIADHFANKARMTRKSA